MSLALRRKIEEAVTAYLKANAATTTILAAKVFSGAAQDEPTGDYLVVSMSNMQPDETIPQVKRGRLTLQYSSAATKGGSERSGIDTILEKLDTFMMKPADDNATWSDGNREAGVILAALNKPAGTDSRTVRPLHIYHIGPPEEGNDVEDEGWVDQLVYDVVAQPMDSH